MSPVVYALAEQIEQLLTPEEISELFSVLQKRDKPLARTVEGKKKVNASPAEIIEHFHRDHEVELSQYRDSQYLTPSQMDDVLADVALR